MKNLLVTPIINQRLMELSNKQGVKMIDYLETFTDKLHTHMKRTGRKPL